MGYIIQNMASASSIPVENMARTGEVVVLFCLFQVMWTKSFQNGRKSISEECRLYKICEHVDNYPVELARKLITELKSQGVFFDKEEAVPEISLTSRFGDFDDDGTLLCKYKTKTYAPKSLPDEHGIPKNILNDDTNPTYIFTMQLCQDKNPIKCSNSNSSESPFPMGYTGVCIQRYMSRRLYYINEQNKTAIENFPIPTTCVCGLKEDDK